MKDLLLTEVRDALQDRSILLCGGDSRAEHFRRLKRTFSLRQVVHCPTRSTDPSAHAFESKLREPTTVLALGLRGLCRTSHGKQLHAVCRQLAIPYIDFFRIPHPNRLAEAIEKHRLMDAITAARLRAA